LIAVVAPISCSPKKSWFIMLTAALIAFSIQTWFRDSTGELLRYFSQLNTTQWGIVSACAVAFGFFCMRSHDVRK